MKGQTGGRRCEKPEGSRGKEGSNAGGTRRGGYRKQSGGKEGGTGLEREKKSDEAQRKMKTVSEITGKPGRMCNERRERETEGWGWGAGRRQ